MALRETENNAYAKFWSDQQRVLWYVMVFSGVVNSNPLGTSCFVSGISITFKCECRIMQIQYTKNLNLGRFESGTTLS